jgi:hypothetical protein
MWSIMDSKALRVATVTSSLWLTPSASTLNPVVA